ncbi:HAD-IA family hydrolase [Pengzhenrongella sp.]|jgi:sugar-phosphatase|uniref:HAD-IA family hydrolase n=1 Tax=Pengzhenrongella sp. TaxID=2888820 RepID=UPI002F9218A9
MSPPVPDVVPGRSESPAENPVLGRTFDAVLFDLDGTLISSIGAVVRSWAQLLREFAIPTDRLGDYHGIPASSLIDTVMHDRTAAERARALVRIVEIEVADTADIEILPGAARALAALAGSGRVAIVTSGSRELARARLVATGLAAPGVVVTADDITRGKPDPEPFVVGATRLGVDANRCLVVEDATAGITAARAAGATTIALTTTTTRDKITGDLVVPDLSALRFELVPAGVRVTRA